MSNDPRTRIPAPSSWRDLAPWAATSLLLTVYIATMCRDLYWYDSAELAMAAVQPGLVHPPGQPLHTLLGWLSTLVVPGRPLIGPNLLSAVCAALTAVPAMSIARRLDPGGEGRGAWLGAAVLVGLGLGDAVWDSATRVEVYSLATLLGVSQVALLMRTLANLEAGTARPREWLWQGLLLGATFSVHPYIAVFLGVATVAAAGWKLLRTRLARPAASASLFLAGGLVGLLPNAWLPISTLVPGNLVWGEPDSVSNLLFYLSGQDYAHNRAGLLETFRQVSHFASWLTGRGWLPAMAGGAVAWWLGRGERGSPGTGERLLPIVLLAGGLLVVGRIGNYRAQVPDFMGYLLPATWIAGAGLASFVMRATRTMQTRPVRILVAGAIVVWVAANCLLPPGLQDRTRDDNRLARALATGYLVDAPEDAVILVASDHVVFPLLYLTEVEGLRSDVVVINEGWASSSWYWRHVAERHPGFEIGSLEAGDRRERIANILARNPDRPVVAETLALASLSKGSITRLGWTFRTGAGSRDVDPVAGRLSHHWARGRLNGWIEDHGAPGTHDRRILAWIATQWGDDEREGGSPGEAVLDYLAGSTETRWVFVPRDLLEPTAWPGDLETRPGVRPYSLLTTPEFNLFLAGALLAEHRSGGQAGMQLVEQAALRGSPEARVWLEKRTAGETR